MSLQAWGIEVDGKIHTILFACEPHSVGCAAKSAELAALAGAHDGQCLVRLPQLDSAIEVLVKRSVCFACALGGPARPVADSPVWGTGVGHWGTTGLSWGGTRLGDDPDRKLGDDPRRKLGDATPKKENQAGAESAKTIRGDAAPD